MPGTAGVGGGGDDPFANIPLPELEFASDVNVSENVRALSEQGQQIAEDGLSVAEQESLVAAAQNMLDQPELPAGDRAALETFLTNVQNAPISADTSTLEDVSPQLAEDLLSTNPQVVEDALDQLFGTKIPPEQRQRLKESGAFSRMAANIAQKNGQESNQTANLKSWDPEVVQQELQKAFEEAEIEVGEGGEQMTQDLAALQEAIGEVADDVSTLNVLSGDVPEANPMTSTLAASTNPEVIENVLLDLIDTSNMTPEEQSEVEAAIAEIAGQIAQNNESGDPIKELSSESSNRIKNALMQMLGEDTEVGENSAVSRALGQASEKISDTNTENKLIFAAIAGGGGEDPPSGPMFGPVPGANPYAQPGIMAMLAPLLSDLAELMAEIIKQSSELKQAMMNLTLSMAQEAYTFAIAAGDAKIKQLEIEVQEAIVNLAISAAGIAMSGVQLGMQTRAHGQAARKYEADNVNGGKPRDIDRFEKGPGRDDAIAARKETLQGNIDRAPDSKTKAEAQKAYDKEFYPDQVVAFKNGKPTADYLRSPEFSQANTTSQSISQIGGSMTQNLTSALQSGNKAIHTSMKMDPVMEEAMMNAMKDFISQLMQTIADTMRSAGEAGQSADKAWDSFNQLFKEMASTITRSIYQG